MEFYWDGTRWRSHLIIQTLDVEPTTMFTGISDSKNPMARLVLPYVGTYTIYALSMFLGIYVATTNDGSKNWTFAAVTVPSATGVGAGMTTAADSASTHTFHVMAVNAVLNATDVYLSLATTKVSTPGNLIVTGASLAYQLIAT